MKRNRAAEVGITNKSQKRNKENNPSSKNNKSRSRTSLQVQKGSNEENNLGFDENEFVQNHQQQQQSSMIGLEEVEWQLNWWPWIVDEEILLGWFPFEDEDFLFSSFSENNKNNSSCYHGWDDYNDLWQLQHIHEVPTCSNN